MQLKFSVAALAIALGFTLGCEAEQSATTAAQAQTVGESAPAPAQAPSANDIRSQVLVTVNGQPVTGEMFGLYYTDRMQKIPGAKNTPEYQNKAINELINIVLLSQAAAADGMMDRPEVATALELQKDQLLSRLALQNHAAQNQPTDEQLKAAYDEKFAGQSNEEFKARHILVKSEDEALAVIETLNGGADFAELAKERSTGPSGKNGGDLGWFDGGQMVKPFSDAVKAMEPGSVSNAPVQTQFGWHVILLEEKRAKEPPTFDSVKQQLASDAQRQDLATYVNSLREKAQVVINESFARKTSPAEAAMPSQGQ
jgi:peptidyl-prolyl cis-trans isomerase C